MKLENHIADLLKLHNCVIVPEFGGFIASYESAWVNRSRSVITPPFKKVLFNDKLIQNDGLLANELVIQHAISFNEAMSEIQMHVNAWRKNLEEGHRIELGEIGFLFKQENKIIFEQNREVNLLLQAYGLSQVSFVDFAAKAVVSEIKTEKPVLVKTEKSADIKEVIQKPVLTVVEKKAVQKSAEKKEEKITPVIELNTAEKIEQEELTLPDEKVIPINQPKKKSRNYKYAIAAAVVLPALFYSYWIPMKTDFLNSGKIHLSDLNPFNKTSTAVYEKRIQGDIPALSTDWKTWEELTSGIPADVNVYTLEVTEELFVPVDLGKTPETNQFNAGGSFHIIGGCFSVETNAENFVKKLSEKGYGSGIVDKKGGLYRVSAGSYGSESEAESALDKFESDGFSGWILKN
ncbi:MAG: SPOR domain-containing protein [Crocinitomicaceae bacterium]|nr:SPOR domain-containing protein [Crocinitomicaceae bacterium]